ncbi:MAG: ABC transporter permease [Flavobacteriaceae bacterium]
MKLALKLAFKNIYGAGLRTVLNVIVLSFSFVIIIFLNGVMDGWNAQAKKDTIEWEYGYGQLRHKDYDPFDPYTILDSHAPIPEDRPDLTPILIHQASIYPEGRMMNIVLKGIAADQQTLLLPTSSLSAKENQYPVIIGKRFAASSKLNVGDEVLLRWRDVNGTYDANTIYISAIFDSNVPTIDDGQIWMNINDLWQMTGQVNEATLLVLNETSAPLESTLWNFYSQKELLSTIEEIIATKKISSSIMYILLLAIALLAIFDTQVLSIFRRQKEIGTYVALGMTRRKVVGLFTVEGSMYSILALFLASLYGTPFFIFIKKIGIPVAEADQEVGLAIAERIFPIYGFSLVVGTVIVVVLASTIVSFLPARKIAKINPVSALKGKLQ